MFLLPLVEWRRKINFAQFEEALKLFAEKKYPGDADAVEKLKSKILEGKGPVAHGVTVKFLLMAWLTLIWTLLLQHVSSNLEQRFWPLKLRGKKHMFRVERGLWRLWWSAVTERKYVDCQQKTVKSGAVDRLTDASKYTGSHKERFDEEGKGKGISGRKDLVDDSGYVTGYKEKGSYDKEGEAANWHPRELFIESCGSGCGSWLIDL
jgi:hypothetical protein